MPNVPWKYMTQGQKRATSKSSGKGYRRYPSRGYSGYSKPYKKKAYKKKAYKKRESPYVRGSGWN